MRDTDKSRYFALTELNNCFIIKAPNVSYLNPFLTALGSNLQFFIRDHVYNYVRADLFAATANLDGTTHV